MKPSPPVTSAHSPMSRSQQAWCLGRGRAGSLQPVLPADQGCQHPEVACGRLMFVEEADGRIPLDEIRLGRGKPLPRIPTPRAIEVRTEWDRESSLDAGERGTETLGEL